MFGALRFDIRLVRRRIGREFRSVGIHPLVGRAGVAVLGALALAGLTACGSSGAAAGSGPSAQSLLNAALHDAAAASGVHELARETAPGVAVSMRNDIGPTSGRQQIDANGGRSVVIVAGGRVYFRGDAFALAGTYQFPITVAQEYAGKWLSMGPTDAGYAQVSGAVTLGSDFRQVVFTGPVGSHPVTLADGRRATAITGMINGPTGTPISAALDVTTSGTVLPIALHARSRQVTQDVSWSDWGQPVAFTVPAGAVPVAGLGVAPGGTTAPPTRA
jgi:hypothetical protein